MRRCFIGLEFTHDKLQPRAVVRVKTRFGPIKRWVDGKKPEVIGGQLRERVALLMPLGFRFRKDEIYARIRGHEAMKWADGKFMCAMMHAEGKYSPHAAKPKISRGGTPPQGDGGEGVGVEVVPESHVSEPSNSAADPSPVVQDGQRPLDEAATSD